MWRFCLWLALLVPLSSLAAQEEERDRSARWRTSYFPYLRGGANDGPVLAARLRYWQPAEYEDRVTYNGALTADGGVTAQGSRYIYAKFQAPQLWDGIRLQVVGGADRLARYGYFGLGNGSLKNDDAVTPEQPFLYRVRRARYGAAVELTRRLKGPFHVALLGQAEQVRFSSLPLPSTFRSDFPARELEQGDASARLAFIYDTRDNEYNTRQGLLLELGSQIGSGGDGYTRTYGVLRGYLSVREGTMVAARVAGSGMGGTPTLNARFYLPAWEHQVPVLGGEYSHRSFDTGRFAGRGVLFGNLEVRHDILALGDLGAITALAFIDAGRVFEEESFEFTTDDMKVGGGGGIGLRLLRSTIFTFNFAGGPDGFSFSVGTGWMF